MTESGKLGRLLLVLSLLVAVLAVDPARDTRADAVGTAYRDAVLADSPVAYWRLGESSGTNAADEVGALTATYAGAPSLGQPGLVADDDLAPVFDGADDLIAVPNSNLINLRTTTHRSIEAWFQVGDVNQRQVIVEEGGITRGLSMYVDQGYVYIAGWNTNNDGADTPWGGIFLSAAVSPNVAHHVVLVLNQPAGTFTGYLDGASIGSSNAAGTLYAHGSATGIGAVNNATRFHDSNFGGTGFRIDGVIDEVAFYNTALSPARVAAHWAAGSTPAVAPSVSFVAPFDGAVVAGSVSIEVSTSDPQEPASALAVEISTDGGVTYSSAAFDGGSGRHSITWDTTTVPEGGRILVARVTDGDANSGTDQIGVTVQNTPGGDAYRETVLADGPVVYYRLGEVTGGVAADEMGAVDGAYTGNPTLGVAGLVPDANTAVSFNGADFVAIPDSTEINRSSNAFRSVEAWFRADSVSGRHVIYKEGGATRGISMYVDEGSVYMGAWNVKGQIWGPTFFSAPVVAGDAYYIVLVLAGGTLEGFVNGVSIGASASAGVLNNHANDVAIGAMDNAARFHTGTAPGQGFFFDGVIDEVAIYNSQLSAGRIVAHYAAGQSSGPTHPAVTFSSPSDGAVVSGSVTLEVAASDPQDSPGQLAVEISTDGGATFGTATFNGGSGRHELAWDTTAVADGPVNLVANVTDTDDNESSASIGVTVANVGATNPSVIIEEPAADDTISGVVTIEATATDPQDPANLLTVDISTDGGATSVAASYNAASGRHELAWDTTSEADGLYVLVADVTDTDGNTGTWSIEVTVDNSAGNRPTVTFIQPTAGAQVAGIVTVKVAATDGQTASELLTVEISTDGGGSYSPAAFDQPSQYHELLWDTTDGFDGPVTLLARVTDPDLYSNTASIGVSVNNAPPTSYRDAVLASGPSVYWRLDEPSGTTAVDIVGGVDSTYAGSPLLDQPALVGDDNSAVEFDGIDDLVAVPDSGLINIGKRNNRTISVWFRADAITNRQMIFDEGGITRGLSIYVDDGSVYLGAWNTDDDSSPDTPWGPVFFSAPVAAGSIYNAVFVLEQATGRAQAYLNGASLGLGVGGTLHSHASDTGIGAVNNAARFHDGGVGSTVGYFFDGTIDEVVVYNVPLDSAAVNNLYQIGASQASDPWVTFETPTQAEVVSGTVLIEMTAQDPQDPGSALTVEVSTDGGATFDPAPFNAATLRHDLSWDTTAVADGQVVITARVTDTDGNTSEQSITVTVSNQGATAMIIAAGDIAGCNVTTDDATADLIDTVIAGTNLPVTVVPVGDLVYEVGSAQEFNDCYDPTWGRHKAITKPVVGNHEYVTPGATGYYDYFGPVAAGPDGYYRYELAGWEIFALNSNCSEVGTCASTSPQVQWLRTELAASSNACTLAFFHHPRFIDAVPRNSPQEFWKALYDFDADVVVSAHNHLYAQSAPQDWEGNLDPANGIRQFIAGTGGRILHNLPGSPHPNHEVIDNSEFGVLVIELAAGGYTWQFRRSGDGAVMYSGVGTCH